MSTAHISQHTALELRARRGRVHGSCSCSCSWDISGRIRICRRTDKTLKLNMVLSVWVSLLRVRQWRAVTGQVLYYLNDSAARPQGDLPWSSIDFSAFAQRTILTTLKMTHSHICLGYQNIPVNLSYHLLPSGGVISLHLTNKEKSFHSR